MQNGWILLYKKLWSNPMVRGNPNALAVWVWLLTHAKDGIVSCGRKQISLDTGVKPETVRYWTTRFLQEPYMISTVKTTSKFSEFRICKWEEYQKPYTGKSTGLLQETYSKTTTNKEQRTKNKETSNVETHALVREVYDHFIVSFNKNPNLYKLTDSRKKKIRVRLHDADIGMLKKAIDNVANSNWHRGDNDRGWEADLDFIIRSYEQVEKLSQMDTKQVTYKADW